MDLSIRVIAFNTFLRLASLASRHPHLSVVQIVKDHSPRRYFVSSAAKGAHYADLTTRCQTKSKNNSQFTKQRRLGTALKLVPMSRIELPTSPLPRECATTEPHGQTLGAS